MKPRSEQVVLRLLATMGQALHRYGIPAHRLEDALTGLAGAFGQEAAVFSTPTLLMIRVGPETGGSTALLRVEPTGAIDLARLCTLDRVAERAATGELGPEDAIEAAWEADRERSGYGFASQLCAGWLVAASAAIFFGGHGFEALLAGLLGLGVEFLELLAGRIPGSRQVRQAATAFLVALCAAALTPYVRPPVVFLATMIIHVPGLTLTTAVAEMATGSLVSGTARMTSAGLVFLQLILGFALAARIDPSTMQASLHPMAVSIPTWGFGPTLFATAVGVHVLFRARPVHLPWVLTSIAAAVLGGRLGAEVLGPDLGALVGATSVGLVGNIGARWRRRPAVVGIMPGLLLLVPGSMGIRALSAMLGEEAVLGLETAFSMVVSAVALVSGLFLANVLVSPRRSL